MHGPLPQATQSTTVRIKFVPPVSSLLSSVEAQTRATRASTSVVFAPGLWRCILMPSTGIHMLHTRYRSSWNIWMRSFKVYGKWSVHSCIHTRVRNAVTLAQARPNYVGSLHLGVYLSASYSSFLGLSNGVKGKPLRRGQPLYKGQMVCPQCVLCLEVLLYKGQMPLEVKGRQGLQKQGWKSNSHQPLTSVGYEWVFGDRKCWLLHAR